VLLRHGEAEGNAELRYLGTTDAPLTARGREQARQLTQAVAVFHLAAIYTSPCRRARETAELVGAATKLPVVVQSRLREEDYGAWENRTRAEVLAHYPEALAAWEAGDDITPPGGESLAEVQARTVACADTLAEAHAGESVALVSHVGPIKALLCAALGLPLVGARRMWLDPASICVVDWRVAATGQEAGTLRVFNAVAHLDPPVRWLT
jgi:probable phosphoglycerate mutase